MEVSDVRRRVREILAESKQTAAERRARRDAAATAWSDVLERVVLPVARQLVQALKVEGFPLIQISTPAESVRIAAEARPQEYVELTLEPDAEEASVVARTSQVRGRETLEEERVFLRGSGAIGAVTEELVLEFLARALAGILVR